MKVKCTIVTRNVDMPEPCLCLELGMKRMIESKNGKWTCKDCTHNISNGSGMHRLCSLTKTCHDVRRCPLNKAINAKMKKGTWTWIQK